MPAAASSKPHAPSHSHPHSDAAGHHNAHGHRHSHPAGERHPAARPGFSLLRLSVGQRLAIAVPLAVLIWAAALAVIFGGGA